MSSDKRSGIWLIAAVAGDWGIGYKNRLLFHLREDMDFFRKKTMGHTVIMGRKTFESLPGRQPLSGRKNIVLSRGQRIQAEGVTICSSVEEALEAAAAHRRTQGEGARSYVIGGGEIYREFLPYASGAYVTKVRAVKKADTFFPNLDQMPGWCCRGIEESHREGETQFEILCYLDIYSSI